ncbi:MAG: hypothetical protein K6U03_02385 [Firmicutes bacterium]|nr:hypothetical protein [Bacillota bacterium]
MSRSRFVLSFFAGILLLVLFLFAAPAAMAAEGGLATLTAGDSLLVNQKVNL